MSLLSALLLSLAAYYALLIGAFAVGLQRVLRAGAAKSQPGPLPSASVVVPARDEAAHVGACVEALLASDYPEGCFEVIVVDDGSSDATADVVRRLMQPSASLRLLSVPVGQGGHKQSALDLGIAAARGEVVLTTDADCVAGPAWLRSMASACGAEGVGFVAGPVAVEPGRSWLGRLQALDLAGLVAVGAGAIGLGRPTICNSANVAFRRQVYEGLQASSTGPAAGPAADEMLMHRLAAETDYAVRFCAAPEAVVSTRPVGDLGAFLAQRQRWASAGARFPSLALVAMSAGIYAFYGALLVGTLSLPFLAGLTPAVLGAWLLKAGADASILIPACLHFGRAGLLRLLPAAQPAQLLYIVYSGAAGAFGRVRWKGRRVT